MTRPRPETLLPLPPTDFHILVALSRTPLHGYGIMKEVESASDGQVRVEVGSLYRTINKLLAKGLVERAQNADDHPRPGRPRQSYRLTALGLAVATAEARRLRDAVAIARVQELLLEGE
jgi:DNA-binding PadR family transcriptional regulator